MDLLPLPEVFPPLPVPQINNVPWSPNILTAFNLLNKAYERASTILRQEADSIRLRFHIDQLSNNFMPILEAMERQRIAENIPVDWLESAAAALGLLVVHLQEGIKGADSM